MKTLKKNKYTCEEIEQFIIESGSDSLSVFGGNYEGGIHCQQIPDELAAFLFGLISSDTEINDYLEIGVAAGGTTYIINHYLNPSRIVLIDDNKHPKAVMRSEILKGISYHEIIGNSQNEEIIKKVKGGFDLVIVDGDHSHTGVWLDIDNYCIPFLRHKGVLMLHDSVMVNWDVPRVVKDLKQDKRFEFINEYVSKKHPIPCGITIFRKVQNS